MAITHSLWSFVHCFRLCALLLGCDCISDTSFHKWPNESLIYTACISMLTDWNYVHLGPIDSPDRILSMIYQYFVYICCQSNVIQATIKRCKTLGHFWKSLYILEYIQFQCFEQLLSSTVSTTLALPWVTIPLQFNCLTGSSMRCWRGGWCPQGSYKRSPCHHRGGKCEMGRQQKWLEICI